MQIGSIVKSSCGHDKGRLSVVVKVDRDRVWIADGKHHKIASPKAKNPKHLEEVGTVDVLPATDAACKRSLKRS